MDNRFNLSFNRTFMELKRGLAEVLLLGNIRFNRTFMELKRRKGIIHRQMFIVVLIVPLWN